jgi:hypothetical protein
MQRGTWLPVVLIAAFGILATGCSDEGSGGAVDSGPDDADAGVDCVELPADCLDIGEDAETQYFGCCFENSVFWCDNGEFLQSDCTDVGSTCGYYSQLEAMWCL